MGLCSPDILDGRFRAATQELRRAATQELTRLGPPKEGLGYNARTHPSSTRKAMAQLAGGHQASLRGLRAATWGNVCWQHGGPVVVSVGPHKWT